MKYLSSIPYFYSSLTPFHCTFSLVWFGCSCITARFSLQTKSILLLPLFFFLSHPFLLHPAPGLVWLQLHHRQVFLADQKYLAPAPIFLPLSPLFIAPSTWFGLAVVAENYRQVFLADPSNLLPSSIFLPFSPLFIANSPWFGLAVVAG